MPARSGDQPHQRMPGYKDEIARTQPLVRHKTAVKYLGRRLVEPPVIMDTCRIDACSPSSRSSTTSVPGRNGGRRSASPLAGPHSCSAALVPLGAVGGAVDLPTQEKPVASRGLSLWRLTDTHHQRNVRLTRRGRNQEAIEIVNAVWPASQPREGHHVHIAGSVKSGRLVWLHRPIFGRTPHSASGARSFALKFDR